MEMNVFGDITGADGFAQPLKAAFKSFESWRKRLALDELFGSVGFQIYRRKAVEFNFEIQFSVPRSNRIPCSHKKITLGGFQKDGYGYYLTAKGYNTRVLAEWLLDEFVKVNRSGNYEDDRAPVAEFTLRGICRYYNLTEQASRNLQLR